MSDLAAAGVRVGRQSGLRDHRPTETRVEVRRFGEGLIGGQCNGRGRQPFGAGLAIHRGHNWAEVGVSAGRPQEHSGQSASEDDGVTYAGD